MGCWERDRQETNRRIKKTKQWIQRNVLMEISTKPLLLICRHSFSVPSVPSRYNVYTRWYKYVLNFSDFKFYESTLILNMDFPQSQYLIHKVHFTFTTLQAKITKWIVHACQLYNYLLQFHLKKPFPELLWRTERIKWIQAWYAHAQRYWSSWKGPKLNTDSL